jgi:general L-amino acid transport system substrate-binding protein
MRSRIGKLAMLAVLLALVAAGCTREDEPQPAAEGGDQAQEQEPQAEAGLLQEIQDRGALRCGVNATVPGFGFETAQGQIEGFDIDFCVAIAAAVFGSPDVQVGEQVELVPIDADARFNALRAGEYDVLVRNTTWTSTRDGAEGVAFAHPNYYDGQAMMVREEDFGAIDEMDGTSVCVTAGTTTELNLADYFGQLGMDFEPLVLEDNDQILQAFRQGRCDGWTSDRSQLAGLKAQYEQELGTLVIFDDVMSKEPLAPGVLDGDAEWFDVVNMVVNGVILAEELEVSSENLDQEIQDPSDPAVGALLGVPVEAGEEAGLSFDPGLAVEADFMQHVLGAVGNYGEIFDRHLTPIDIERGVNALWTDGGIQYAIPFR